MNRSIKNKKTVIGIGLAVMLSTLIVISPHIAKAVITIDQSNQNNNTNTGYGNQGVVTGSQSTGNYWGDSTSNVSVGNGNGGSGPSAYSANSSNNGTSGSGASSNSSTKNAGSCIASQMLSKLLTSSISSAMGKTTTSMTQTETTTKVPVTLADTKVAQNQESHLNAHTGSFTVAGIQTGLGWDGVAYCIVNTIIDYIVNETIRWANSGFKGNPSFVRNPEEFFKNIADREASSLIQQVAYGVAGVNVCKPFRVVIATGLQGSYARNSSSSSMLSCSLTQMQQNMMQSGKYTITTPTDWLALTQPQNNKYYSYISAGDEMAKRIQTKNNTTRLDLTINKGFMSQKKCKDDSKPESKDNPCDTTTPGSVIADSLSHTLNIPKERLVSAQKFDQMIDTIVNNLIKIALGQILTQVTGQAPTQATAGDYYTAIANRSATSSGIIGGTNGGSGGTGGTTGGGGGGGVGGSISSNALNGLTFPPRSGLSNDQVLQMINDSGILDLPTPSDSTQYFAGGIPTAEGYLSLLAGIANSESGFNPNDGMNHAAYDVGHTYSEGLFSLTPTDAIVQRLGYGSDAALADPANNTQAAIAILQNQIQSTGSIAGSPGNHYWGPLYRHQ